LLRPYPQYTGVTASNDGNRDTVYHSLQMKLEKRFHQGALCSGVHLVEEHRRHRNRMSWLEAGPLAGIQNNNNLRQERAISGFDVPHA